MSKSTKLEAEEGFENAITTSTNSSLWVDHSTSGCGTETPFVTESMHHEQVHLSTTRGLNLCVEPGWPQSVRGRAGCTHSQGIEEDTPGHCIQMRCAAIGQQGDECGPCGQSD